MGKYRINPHDTPRVADAQSRKYPFGDLREKGGLAFFETSAPLALRHRAHPDGREDSLREQDVRFTPVDIPKSLDRFLASPAAISGLIHPGKYDIDWIIC